MIASDLQWSTESFFPGECPLSHEEINEYSRRLERWWKSKQAAWGVEKLRLNYAVFSHWFTVHTQELIIDRAGFVRVLSENEMESFEQEMENSKQHAVQERKSDVQAMVQLSEQINVETDKIRKKPTPTLTPIVRTPNTISPAYSTSRTPPVGASAPPPAPYTSIKDAAVLAALQQSQKIQENKDHEHEGSHAEAKQTTTLTNNEFLQSYLNQHRLDDHSEDENSQEHKK